MGVTASSCDSAIKLWKVDTDRLSPVTLLGSVDTGCRITCMTAWHPGLRNAGGNKRSKVEEQDVVKSSFKKFRVSVKSKTSTVVESLTVTEEVSEKKGKMKKKKKPSVPDVSHVEN